MLSLSPQVFHSLKRIHNLVKYLRWRKKKLHLVGNNAKGRISKRMFQESKARHIFRRTNISYPLIHTHTCAYQGVRNVCFSENLSCFVFLKHSFWDSPFCLITNHLRCLKVFSIRPWKSFNKNHTEISYKKNTISPFNSFVRWRSVSYRNQPKCWAN